MSARRCAGLRNISVFCLALQGVATPVLAQAADESAAPRLELTLNSARATEAGDCRLSFVIRNDLGAGLEKMVAEAVLFDADGRVATMTLFDFGALPSGRPRVRQFDLAEQSCDGIKQVLINGIGSCEGDGLRPGACLDGLRLSTDTDIEVTG